VSYFDAAFIAKFYVDEPESAAVRNLAEGLGTVSCAVFGRLEVAAVFHRKWREQTFSRRAFEEVSDQFADDCNAGLWTWLPLTNDLVEAAAAAVRGLPRTVFLRSADALHLVCATEHGFAEIYSNDRHVLAAASHFKLMGRTLA